MAGRKKAEKPEEETKTAGDAVVSGDNVSTDANNGGAAPADTGTEAPKTDAVTAAVTSDAEGPAADVNDKTAADQPVEKPEETASADSVTISSMPATTVITDAGQGTSPTPNLRRFVVFKPVRFNRKRIPRGGRVTVTRAGHDELAGMGADSSVWENGEPVETE